MLHCLQTELYTHMYTRAHCSYQINISWHTLWSGVPLWSTLHLCSSAGNTNSEQHLQRDRQAQTLNASSVLESLGLSSQVIWHCWLRIEVKLEQRGKYHLLSAFIQIQRTEHEKPWPSLHLLDSAFSLNNLVAISFIPLSFLPPPPRLTLQVRSKFLSLPQMSMPARWTTTMWCWAGLSLNQEAGSRSPSTWNGSVFTPTHFTHPTHYAHTKDAALLLLLQLILLVCVD